MVEFPKETYILVELVTRGVGNLRQRSRAFLFLDKVSFFNF